MTNRTASSIRNSRDWHTIRILASHWRKPKGFTIVELLVVVAIIAILVSTAFALLTSARARSRDVLREEHIKTLQNALALYATNAGAYPATDVSGTYLTASDPVSAALVAAGAIPVVPPDPLNTGSHRYHYRSADGAAYTLTYHLETGSIPGKAAGEQQAGP